MPAVAKEGEGLIEKLANNEKEDTSSYSWNITSVTGAEDLYTSIQTQLSYFCAESRTYSLVVW